MLTGGVSTGPEHDQQVAVAVNLDHGPYFLIKCKFPHSNLSKLTEACVEESAFALQRPLSFRSMHIFHNKTGATTPSPGH